MRASPSTEVVDTATVCGAAVTADRKTSWRLETFLGDKYAFGESQNPSILKLPVEQLFAWCHANRDSAPAFLAAVLPVLTSRKPEDVVREIHPLMKRLIDEFGDDERVLYAITRNIGTYGWSVSRTKYYELYEIPLKALENHKLRRVRFWAIDMLRNLGLEKLAAKTSEEHFEGENDL